MQMAVSAGDNDVNNLNNIGATFHFYVETAATDMDILTDGTDKFKGGIMIAVDDGSKKAFIPAATNDVITMNGSTKGGIVGSVVSFTAIDTATYLVPQFFIAWIRYNSNTIRRRVINNIEGPYGPSGF